MTTEQPAGAPSENPYEQMTNAYYSPGRGPASPPPAAAWAPEPSRSVAGPIVVGLVAVVMLGFGLAFGANEFAKREVCGDIASASAGTPAAGTPAVQANNAKATVATTAATTESQNVEELKDEIDTTRGYARLLVLDGDLRDAVTNLTTDADSALRLGEEFKNLSPEERQDNAPRVKDLASDMENHWRAVQRACGQTETGLQPAA
ncbi:hypothetical protein [Catenuloplanes japonicus]|uniref:hypothetical protein n=1 Tax=Catenuloplanes japonicus TaxID=33876 RepID=UPI0005246599|nr:hypothetical protein [Catenuloplanes japonicus]